MTKPGLAVGLDLSLELAAVVELCGSMFFAVRASTRMGSGPGAPDGDETVFYIGDALENLGALGEYLRNGDTRAAANEARTIAGILRDAAAQPDAGPRCTPLSARYRAAFARAGAVAGSDQVVRAAEALERLAERVGEAR